MRRALAGLMMILVTAASAQAVTLRDIVDLTKAGLGEEVLLALIEVDGGVFQVDAETLAGLKAAGVSEKVIVALVRSGRVRPTAEAQSLSAVVEEQQAPPVVYIQQPPQMTVVREVAVPFPVYVAIPGAARGRHGRASRQDEVQPSITAPALVQGRQRYLTDTPPPPKHQEPVLLGLGRQAQARCLAAPDAYQEIVNSPSVCSGLRVIFVRPPPQGIVEGLSHLPAHQQDRGHQGGDTYQHLARANARLARWRLIQIAVHTVREQRRLQLTALLLLLEMPFGGRADALLLPSHFFADVLAVRRGVLDFGVQLGPEDDREARQVQPRHQHDHRADRAIGFVVAAEVADIQLETERDEPPTGASRRSSPV